MPVVGIPRRYPGVCRIHGYPRVCILWAHAENPAFSVSLTCLQCCVSATRRTHIMLCTVTAEPLPLGDGPFLDLTFARCAPKMWEGDRICCVGQILPATQVRSLGETKRKNVFSTSPREIETVAQKPIKTRRTGTCFPCVVGGRCRRF